MTTRRAAAALLFLFLLASGTWAAEVAVLKSTDTPVWRPAIEALKRSSTGQTITEYDLAGDKAEAARIVSGLKGKAAVLVAMGPLAAQVAREAAPEIPMVFCMIQDPGSLGLLNAANTSGVAFAIPVRNQLFAYRAVYPRGVRLGVVYNPENAGRQVEEAKKASAMVRMVLVDRPVASEREVPQALRSLLQGSQAVDALWIPADPVLLGGEARRHILSEMLKAGKPVFSFSSALVQEGALVSNGPDMESIGEQAAGLVNRMAAGERVSGELQMPKAELVINKKMADKLGIEVPADALRVAAKIL